jgi:hypothetical protein
MEFRNYKSLRRLGPGIWSLAILEQGYNRKTKSENKEEILAKMGWSDAVITQGEDLHIRN